MKQLNGKWWWLLLIGLLTIGGAACSDEETPAKEEEEDSRVVEVTGEYTCEELCCMNGGKRIYGLMYKPTGRTSEIPTVILSHSAYLTHAAMKPYAVALARQGYAAYCFDFCGGSGQSLSDGSMADMTLFTEVTDLEAVLAAVRKLDYVDAARCFLLGSSQGGVVSALVAEAHADEVEGLILFYPAFNIPELANQFAGMASGDQKAYIEALKGYDVFEHIGNFDKRVLILHGSSDFIVSTSYSERAAALYPQARLVVIEGATHGFNEENLGGFGSLLGGTVRFDDEVMGYVFEFLE